MLLKLQPDIIYGPVDSRRLGKSLGINLMPGKYKLCSFNCVYCHYGWTKKHAADFTPFRDQLPNRDKVVSAVEKAVRSDIAFGYITFSGNGEPTLHPDFPQLVEDIKNIRDKYRPEARLGLLSNSSGLRLPGVTESIASIDYPMFKLDAGTERIFKIINRPARGISFDQILSDLYSLSGIYIQTLLVDGDPGNTEPDELEAYFEHLMHIRPRQVHIYSIDRPVPKSDLKLVPPERLEDIAETGRKKTGLDIRAFYPGKII